MTAAGDSPPSAQAQAVVEKDGVDMSQTPPETGPAPPIRTGVALGRYQVQEFLGQGPHGPTFRGYDPHVSRSVVIEALETLRDEEPRARLSQAAPWLVQLRHPNLVDVYEVGERQGLPYLVTGHVDGVSLGDAMRAGTSAAGALRILHGAARGVDHVHAQSIVHGDLRPATVLLGPQSRPLLREVGLVPLLDPGFRGSAFGIRTGALHYQAPEQLERGDVNAATDRYAFATMAYELLTGAMPFAAQTTSEILAAKERMDPVPASTRNPQLGPATDAVLAAGLARDPAARWQSCAQMAQALEQAIADDAYQRQAYIAQAAEPYPSAAPAAPTPRRRWPWVLAGLGVLAVAAAAVALWWFGFQQQQQSGPSVIVSDSTVLPGDSITVTGSHLPANQFGTIELQSSAVLVGTFQADRYGATTATAHIPKDAQPGDHLISLCWSNTCPASQRLTVLQPTPSPSPSPTPTPAPTRAPTPTPAGTPTPTATPTPTPGRPSPSPTFS